MSFILDALKKSESDRQQKATPGIADVPTGSRQNATPRWIPVLAALLVVNLAVVLYVVFRPSPTAAPSVVTVPLDAPSASGGTVDSRPETIAAVIADEPPVEPATADDGEPAIQAPAPAALAVDGPAPATEPARSAPTVAEAPAEAPAEPADHETYLTLNDLRASGKIDLPEMHIDLHVFSSNPAERFVFINMDQYRENATMKEGPRVRRITTEGVLLDYRGSTFLLPRD